MSANPLWKDISPAELKTMYMEYGETYKTLAARLDVCQMSVYRIVKNLLTDEQLRRKKHENFAINRARQINGIKAPKVTRDTPFAKRVNAETVETVRMPKPAEEPKSMMERMKERDMHNGVVRQPMFEGFEVEQTVYHLRNDFGTFLVDTKSHSCEIRQGENSLTVTGYSEMLALIKALQNINANM